MAGSGGDVVGGVGQHQEGASSMTGNNMSYSDRLKTNVRFDQRLKRNVLEITLAKSNAEADAEISVEAIAKVFNTLGINIDMDDWM